VLAKKERP